MFTDEKAVGEVQLPKLGTLRLSTAIREGAKKRPQTRLAYFKDGASCALGAAWEGLGNGYHEGLGMIAHDLTDHFGISPDTGKMVVALNDSGWTREQIADWLETRGQ